MQAPASPAEAKTIHRGQSPLTANRNVTPETTKTAEHGQEDAALPVAVGPAGRAPDRRARW